MHYFAFKLPDEGQEAPGEDPRRNAIDGAPFEMLEPGKTWSESARRSRSAPQPVEAAG